MTTKPPLTADDIWKSNGQEARAPRPRPWSLAETELIFNRWIRDRDPIPTRVVLCTYIANRALDGDPVWTVTVGGSGIGKTERLAPLAAMPDVILESSITGPAALLSGTAKKDKAKDASGGILRKVPKAGGLLVLKDFTSIIDMHRDARAEVLAALREIYDGRWDRSIGTDSGRTLTWEGRLGLIAGCTTAIDAAHAVISTMGTRFLLVRLLGTGEENQRRSDEDLAGSAFDHVGAEQTMRTELRAAVHGLLTHLPGRPYDKAMVRAPLIALASHVALARSPVDRDQRSEIRLVLDPEAPTRLIKMLTQLWRAAGLLGLERRLAWEMVLRVGLDSIPKLRRSVLDYLEAQPVLTSTTQIADAVEHPATTTRRALEDLTAHRVTLRHVGGPGKADRWDLAPKTRDWLTCCRTFSVLSDHRVSPTPSGSLNSKNIETDKTEKVTPNKTGSECEVTDERGDF